MAKSGIAAAPGRVAKAAGPVASSLVQRTGTKAAPPVRGDPAAPFKSPPPTPPMSSFLDWQYWVKDLICQIWMLVMSPLQSAVIGDGVGVGYEAVKELYLEAYDDEASPAYGLRIPEEDWLLLASGVKKAAEGPLTSTSSAAPDCPTLLLVTPP